MTTQAVVVAVVSGGEKLITYNFSFLNLEKISRFKIKIAHKILL
jgi:hypothetical protein